MLAVTAAGNDFELVSVSLLALRALFNEKMRWKGKRRGKGGITFLQAKTWPFLIL